MKNILNFLSENKHAISFLLIFSEVALMIYGYIIDFHFGNIVLYVFCSSFIFYILASPFLIAKTRDENGDYMGKANSSYIFGLILNILFIIFLILNGMKEIGSNQYNLLPTSYIQTELDDNKITYFESFKILHREYKNLLEVEEKIKKDVDNYELKQKEIFKEKILKEITENKSQQNNE